MGLIYVQFGNRTDRYEPPYDQGRGVRERKGPSTVEPVVFEDLGFRE